MGNMINRYPKSQHTKRDSRIYEAYQRYQDRGLERTNTQTNSGPGLKEQVKSGAITASDALAQLPVDASTSHTAKWLRKRV